MIASQEDGAWTSALDWASKLTGLSWIHVENPKALAGQNKLKLIEGPNQERFALRLSPIQASWSRSGAWIRSRMIAAGYRMPIEVGHQELSEHGLIASLQTRVPGEDLELVWARLSHEQAMGVARDVARLVGASREIFSELSSSRGWGRFAPPDGSAERGGHLIHDGHRFCQEWLAWVAPKARDVGGINSSLIERVERRAETLEAHWEDVQARAFVWDAAERNVMIEKGIFQGLVDQDELMMGDPWAAPALAWACLDQLGAPWAQDYAMEWAQVWGGHQGDVDRMRLMAALFALQSAAKSGRKLPDGRSHQGPGNESLERLTRWSD